MSLARSSLRPWFIALAAAAAFVIWADIARVDRVVYVSHLDGRASTPDRLDAGSATGYANGQRELIVPERNESSFDWIAQTQQMLAKGELRVRHVDYENAPAGRDVGSTSPYRWWLGVLSWLDHEASGKPVGYAVETAALLSDAILQVALLVLVYFVVASCFGGFAAALASVAIAAFFPFASGYLPGMPDQLGLELALALVSSLGLVAGLRSASNRRGWFAVGGFLGGLGMWVSVPTQAPIMLGVFAGAILSALITRGDPDPQGPSAWRTWGYCSGITVLVACLLEYFPSGMGAWTLESVHPAYGLALVGLGEILAVLTVRIKGVQLTWTGRTLAVLVASAGAVVSIPLIMWKTGRGGFLAEDLLWPKLTRLPEGPVAPGTFAWLAHDGATPAALATLLPLAALLPALWLMLRGGTSQATRAGIALALGPVAVSLGFAAGRLGWWGFADVSLLVLIVATAGGPWASLTAFPKWSLVVITASAAALGAVQLRPMPVAAALTPREGQELVDRHMAHWLSNRSGGSPVTVFAPPNETLGLWFYGGLRGIGTFSPDNHAGFGTTLNIAAATSLDDVQNNLRALGVRYVVVPSWDPFFDEFAGLYLDKRFAGRPSVFVNELRRMNLPPWLRPVPYQMPVAAGAGQSVVVFEVVDEQAPAAAAARLADYLVETGDLAKAQAAGEALKRFPGDVGALAARVQVLGATGDTAGASSAFGTLLARLANGADRYLPWDRRVSLSIVLVQAGRENLAREQVRRCIAELNEERLRSLSTGSLYALLVLGHSFGFQIADPRLRELAPELLPETLRSRI
ncbi:MAG TPA: hypothetical protein VFE25_00940 [Opitutaceae bacterium]|nr:hypothetical protein [Opitutaceae bacterium]